MELIRNASNLFEFAGVYLDILYYLGIYLNISNYLWAYFEVLHLS